MAERVNENNSAPLVLIATVANPIRGVPRVQEELCACFGETPIHKTGERHLLQRSYVVLLLDERVDPLVQTALRDRGLALCLGKGLEVALELAERIAVNAPLSVVASKQVIQKSSGREEADNWKAQG